MFISTQILRLLTGPLEGSVCSHGSRHLCPRVSALQAREADVVLIFLREWFVLSPSLFLLHLEG